MRKIGVLILTLLIILVITGCEQPKKTIITGEVVSQGQLVSDSKNGFYKTDDKNFSKPDYCKNVRCDENFYCVNGKCQCELGYKKCNTLCLSKDQCCTDEDCGDGKVCQDNVCGQGCNLLACESNKVCTENGICGCEFGYEWCEYQVKCIPLNNCCTDSECRGSYDCIRTGRSIDFCVEDNGLMCKRISEQSTKVISINSKDYTIKVNKMLSDKSAHISINGKDVGSLIKNNKITFDGVLVYFTEIVLSGGNCQE